MVKDSVLSLLKVQAQSLVRRWFCNQGPLAAVLQSLHLDTPLLRLQNAKTPYGTKNNYMRAAIGINFGPKDTKTKKKTQQNQLPFLKSWEHKTVLGAKAMHWACTPALSTTDGWAKHLTHASNLTPGRTSTLPPYKDRSPPTGRAHKQGNLLCVLTPSSPGLQQGPLEILA